MELALPAASNRVSESLATAKALLEGGFPGPAYVWAVRSVEMFFKEFLLAPHFYEQAGQDWWKALKLAEREFGSSNWKRAMEKVEEVYGPLDPMLTDDDQDPFQVWRTGIVRVRGDIVHGRMGGLAQSANLVIAWAEQLVLQMKLRLIVARKHPVSKAFIDAYMQAVKLLKASGEEASPADSEM